MLLEILGGAVLGKALSGKTITPIKDSAKKYVVMCDNKINGNEIINVVFISSDKSEALAWAKTAIESMCSLMEGLTYSTQRDVDISLAEYSVHYKNVGYKYAVFAY